MTNFPVRTSGFTSPLATIDRDFGDLFSGFFRPLHDWSARPGGFAPPVDVTDRGDHFLVQADLPGVNKEDIDVYLDGDRLVIEAESQGEDNSGSEQSRAVIRERRYGKWVRALQLRSEVEPERIEATYDNGVLELRVPKPEDQASQQKRITVH